jgi:hypothetical protein
MVDKNNRRRYAQISGGGKNTLVIYIGRGEKDFVIINITAGQSCILYRESTVLYIRPRIWVCLEAVPLLRSYYIVLN